MAKPHILASVVALATIAALQDINVGHAQSLTLDTFTVPDSNTLTNGATGGTASRTEMLGASSDRFVERDRVVFSTSGTVDSQIVGFAEGTNEARGSNTGSTDQRHLLIYDGAGLAMMPDVPDSITGNFNRISGGVDITNSNTLNTLRFTFSNISNNMMNPANIDIRAISGSDMMIPEVSVLLPDEIIPVSGTSVVYDVPFSEFTNVNFTDLTALIIQFDNLAEANLVLDSIEAVEAPEPTTVVGTIGAVCFGAGLALKYRKRLRT